MNAKTPVDLGLIMRERRKQLGLDQSALAARVGVSRQWLIEIEQGKSRAELGLVLRTLHALGLVVDVAAEGGGAEAKRTKQKLPTVQLDAIIDRLGRPAPKSKR